MEPILVGFFPYRPVGVPKGLHLTGVELICSVSHCIAEVPPDWIDHWTHNDLGFFDTQDAAKQVAGDGNFEVFGYRVYPIRISGTAVEDFDVPVSPTENLTGFVRLGIDIVSRSVGPLFECSPLSCNAGANEFEVNGFCLIDDFVDAVDIAVRLEKGSYEPGPYHLVEVWRARSESNTKRVLLERS